MKRLAMIILAITLPLVAHAAGTKISDGIDIGTLNQSTDKLPVGRAGDNRATVTTPQKIVDAVFSNRTTLARFGAKDKRKIDKTHILDLPSSVDFVTTGQVNSGATTITMPSALLTSADIGKPAYVVGVKTQYRLITTVADVSGTTLTLANAVGATLPQAYVFVATDVTAQLQSNLDALAASGAARVRIGDGNAKYAVNHVVVPTGITLESIFSKAGGGWQNSNPTRATDSGTWLYCTGEYTKYTGIAYNSNTISIPGGNFSAADIGKQVMAVAAGGIDGEYQHIVAVPDATHITLNDVPDANIANADVYVGWHCLENQPNSGLVGINTYYPGQYKWLDTASAYTIPIPSPGPGSFKTITGTPILYPGTIHPRGPEGKVTMKEINVGNAWIGFDLQYTRSFAGGKYDSVGGVDIDLAIGAPVFKGIVYQGPDDISRLDKFFFTPINSPEYPQTWPYYATYYQTDAWTSWISPLHQWTNENGIAYQVVSGWDTFGKWFALGYKYGLFIPYAEGIGNYDNLQFDLTRYPLRIEGDIGRGINISNLSYAAYDWNEVNAGIGVYAVGTSRGEGLSIKNLRHNSTSFTAQMLYIRNQNDVTIDTIVTDNPVNTSLSGTDALIDIDNAETVSIKNASIYLNNKDVRAIKLGPGVSHYIVTGNKLDSPNGEPIVINAADDGVSEVHTNKGSAVSIYPSPVVVNDPRAASSSTYTYTAKNAGTVRTTLATDGTQTWNIYSTTLAQVIGSIGYTGAGGLPTLRITNADGNLVNLYSGDFADGLGFVSYLDNGSSGGAIGLQKSTGDLVGIHGIKWPGGVQTDMPAPVPAPTLDPGSTNFNQILAYNTSNSVTYRYPNITVQGSTGTVGATNLSAINQVSGVKASLGSPGAPHYTATMVMGPDAGNNFFSMIKSGAEFNIYGDGSVFWLGSYSATPLSFGTGDTERLSIRADGRIRYGGQPAAPANNAACVVGDTIVDAANGFLYLCVATNSWKRAAFVSY